MNVEIHTTGLGGSALVRAYLAGEAAVQRWYAGDPCDPDAFRHRWHACRDRFAAADRASAAASLHPTTERARERLERFVSEGGAMVTTGQQTGLFTGPLYTIYKILTAVRLAQLLEEHLATTVLPVFWSASEDHDWDEVNHASFVGPGDELVRVQLSRADARPLPMSEVVLDDSVETALSMFAQHVGDGSYTSEVMKLLRAGYRPGRSMATGFREVIQRLFAPFDLLVTDAADPALKEASVPVLERELRESARHEELLRRRSDELVDAGYRSQVPIVRGATNLFLRSAHGRERLYREGGELVTRATRQRLSPGEAQRLLRNDPRLISPNVLLRPVVESSVFPVLAYVAGPGEIAYFGQLGSLFEAHGQQMPLVVPRASLLLVEAPVRERLDRLGSTPEESVRPRHEVIESRSGELLPPEVRQALDELRGRVAGGFEALMRLSARLDPTLERSIGSRRNRALLEVSGAERKIRRALKRSDTEWLALLDAVRTHLAPGGAPQERVLSVMPYLARHGLGLLRELAARIPAALRQPVR